ncbi:hypothetical protein B0H11DRAFT_2019628, partial [Mycena galericulata]
LRCLFSAALIPSTDGSRLHAVARDPTRLRRTPLGGSGFQLKGDFETSSTGACCTRCKFVDRETSLDWRAGHQETRPFFFASPAGITL